MPSDDPLPALRRRAARCVTHHHACDCRELRFVEVEAEHATLRETLREVLAEFAPHAPGYWSAPALIPEPAMQDWRTVAGLEAGSDG